MDAGLFEDVANKDQIGYKHCYGLFWGGGVATLLKCSLVTPNPRVRSITLVKYVTDAFGAPCSDVSPGSDVAGTLLIKAA